MNWNSFFCPRLEGAEKIIEFAVGKLARCHFFSFLAGRAGENDNLERRHVTAQMKDKAVAELLQDIFRPLIHQQHP